MNGHYNLDDKTVLITGCNGGMGLATSIAFAEAGARVVAVDLHAQPHEALATLDGLTYREVDVASEGDIEHAIEALLAMHGRLDCAVNAAAIEFETARLADCATDDFDRMIRVNLRGVFLCMKHELKAMLAHATRGTIVNIASTTSFQAGRIQPAYTASKHGVVGLTRQAAVDYAADGIRVNAIAPGNVDTPMLRNAVERRGLDAQQIEKRMLLGRFGRPQEVAAAALWLCSDASSFTTGHVLTVEGGMLLT